MEERKEFFRGKDLYRYFENNPSKLAEIVEKPGTCVITMCSVRCDVDVGKVGSDRPCFALLLTCESICHNVTLRICPSRSRAEGTGQAASFFDA
jgi:hypothetical protein